MKRILTVLLTCAVCAGCVGYPAARSIDPFDAQVVYYTNVILTNGTHLVKGAPVTEVPLSIRYSVQQKKNQMIVGPKWEVRKTYLWYTFTGEQGEFTIPRLTRVYWAWRAPGSRTVTSVPELTFLFPDSYVTLTNANRENPYRLIYPNDPEKTGLLAELKAKGTPLHRGDRKRLTDWLQNQGNEEGQPPGGAYVAPEAGAPSAHP